MDQGSAIELCRLMEEVAPEFGAHVALTGGCLYKDGRRKDADILFYRIRQQQSIDEKGLLDALVERIGVVIGKRFGWVVKATWDSKPIDLFFPEENQDQIRQTKKCTHVIQPNPGEKLNDPQTCPKCYQPMFYSVNVDLFIHPGHVPDIATNQQMNEGECSVCGKPYFYIVTGNSNDAVCETCKKNPIVKIVMDNQKPRSPVNLNASKEWLKRLRSDNDVIAAKEKISKVLASFR